jgi:hypothetical protein
MVALLLRGLRLRLRVGLERIVQALEDLNQLEHTAAFELLGTVYDEFAGARPKIDPQRIIEGDHHMGTIIAKFERYPLRLDKAC